MGRVTWEISLLCFRYYWANYVELTDVVQDLLPELSQPQWWCLKNCVCLGVLAILFWPYFTQYSFPDTGIPFPRKHSSPQTLIWLWAKWVLVSLSLLEPCSVVVRWKLLFMVLEVLTYQIIHFCYLPFEYIMSQQQLCGFQIPFCLLFGFILSLNIFHSQIQNLPHQLIFLWK